jgi:hypothetical protein
MGFHLSRSAADACAKFSANTWSLKKVGNIEFFGSKASTGEAAREEIVVTGLTLFYCRVLRTSSIISLFGAVVSRPGYNHKDIPEVDSKQDKPLH